MLNPISNLAHVGTVRAETRMLCRLVFRSPAASQCWLGHDANLGTEFSCEDCAAKQRASDPHIWETVISCEVCTPQQGGAFTSNVAAPCPVPAAYKPHVPGLTSAVGKQDLSVQRKINILYSSKHTWLRSDVRCGYSPVWLFLCFQG